MNLSANPDYQMAHPPRIKFIEGDEIKPMSKCVQFTTLCPNLNQQVLYTQNANKNSMHSDNLFGAQKEYNYLFL